MSDVFGPVITGMLIGLLPAVVGGIVSYWGYLKKPEQNKRGVLLLLLSTTGTLVAAGGAAFVAGAITGELAKVILTGAGVFIGFALGFGLMLMFYLRIHKFQAV